VLYGPTVKPKILLPIVLLSACSSMYQPDRPPEKVLLPDGFVGWARIDYGVEGEPPLPRDGEYVIVKYPVSGHLRTSSRLVGKWGLQELYYYSGDRVVPAPKAFQINGGFSSFAPGQRGHSWFAFFGTEADARTPEPEESNDEDPELGAVVPNRRLLAPQTRTSGTITGPYNKGLERTRRVGVPASRAVVRVSPCRSTQCSADHL